MLIMYNAYNNNCDIKMALKTRKNQELLGQDFYRSLNVNEKFI